MKKLVSILLSLVMILSLSIGAFANENVTVKLNGETLVFDVQPQLIGGRTMVPLRKIFESLGAVVTWEESTSTVTAYNEFYIVKATIGNNTMYVNGEERWMDVPPMEVNSRTLVPARFVAEAFNCDVQWDADTQTVYITAGEADYSQVEKETTPVSNNSGEVSNSSAFEKLKNTIVSKGEKDGDEYRYDYIDREDDGYRYYSYSYNITDREIVLYCSNTDDDRNSYGFLVLLEGMDGRADTLFKIDDTGYPERKIFGEFNRDSKKFIITDYENLSDTRLQEVANKLMDGAEKVV